MLSRHAESSPHPSASLMKTNFAVIQCYGGTEWWWEIPVLTLCPELLAVILGRDWLHQAYSSMELIPLLER